MSDLLNQSQSTEVITSKNAIIGLAIVTAFNFFGNIANLIVTIISKKIEISGELNTERIKKKNDELYNIYNCLKLLRNSVSYNKQQVDQINTIKETRNLVAKNEILFSEKLSDILHNYLDYFTNIVIDSSRVDKRKEIEYEKCLRKHYRNMKA